MYLLYNYIYVITLQLPLVPKKCLMQARKLTEHYNTKS